MTCILVECTDHRQIYGILTVDGVGANEIQDKIYEIKEEFDDNDWEIVDVLNKLPNEWQWKYNDIIGKVEI